MSRDKEGLMAELNSLNPENMEVLRLLASDRLHYGVSYERISLADDGSIVRKRYDPTTINIIESERKFDDTNQKE